MVMGGSTDPREPPSSRDRASLAASAADRVWRPVGHPKGATATPEELAEWDAAEKRQRIAGRARLTGRTVAERKRLFRQAAKTRASWLEELIEPMADLLVAAATKDSRIMDCANRFAEHLKVGSEGMSEEDETRGDELRTAQREATQARIRSIEGMTEAEQWQLDFAADYTDEWYMVGHGESLKAFRSFYVCDAKVGTEHCGTMTLSSQWTRRHEDPLAQKQRWYCPACGARYKTTSGVLVELVHGGATHHVRADFPPESIQEVKWASVQRSHDHATTPETLLAAIPDAAPASGVVLQKIPTLPGNWLYNREAL